MIYSWAISSAAFLNMAHATSRIRMINALFATLWIGTALGTIATASVIGVLTHNSIVVAVQYRVSWYFFALSLIAGISFSTLGFYLHRLMTKARGSREAKDRIQIASAIYTISFFSRCIASFLFFYENAPFVHVTETSPIVVAALIDGLTEAFPCVLVLIILWGVIRDAKANVPIAASFLRD
jgi:hypothetical protein